MSFRVDLVGRSDDEPERIGIIFSEMFVSEDRDGAVIELSPEDALELAAQISDMYAVAARWFAARELHPDAEDEDAPNASGGLDVESWRLKMLLDAGYELGAAERLARSPVDLHAAVKLAQDAGPALAAAILT